MKGEPLEATLYRVGKMVEVLPAYGGDDPVERILRYDTYSGFYVAYKGEVRKVRHLEYDRFILMMEGKIR